MGELLQFPPTRVSGGGLRPREGMSTSAARRWPAVDGDGSLESASVSKFRSARTRRFAVMVVALIIVVWAVRFVVAPMPQM